MGEQIKNTGVMMMPDPVDAGYALNAVNEHGVISFGDDNLYPDRTYSIYINSLTPANCIDEIRDSIVGDYKDFFSLKVNLEYSLFALLFLLAEDLSYNLGFAFSIGRNALGQVTAINYKAFRHFRKKKEGGLKYCKNWQFADMDDDFEIIDVESLPNDLSKLSDVHLSKPIAKWVSAMYGRYPVSPLSKCFDWSLAEIGLAVSTSESSWNGFNNKVFFMPPKDASAVDAKMTEEMKVKQKETLEDTVGAKGASIGVLGKYVEIKEVGNNRRTGSLIEVSEVIEKKIAKGLKVPNILAQIHQDAVFSDGGKQFQEARKELYRKTMYLRALLFNSVADILEICADEQLRLAAPKLKKLIYEQSADDTSGAGEDQDNTAE